MFMTILILAIVGILGLTIYMDEILEGIGFFFGAIYFGVESTIKYIHEVFN